MTIENDFKQDTEGDTWLYIRDQLAEIGLKVDWEKTWEDALSNDYRWRDTN